MHGPKHQEPLVISSLVTHSTSHTPLANHASKPSDDGEKTDTETITAPAPSSSPSPSTSTASIPLSTQRIFWNHLMADVRPSLLAEFQLILLTFCTGIQDAASFPDYRCFTSNQTGNTVFLMLGLVMPEVDGNLFITANIGASLGFFLAGAWLTGQIGHFVGPRQRLWLIACNFLQACMVFGAASIQYKFGVDLEGNRTIAVIGLLAFSAGSQIVQSRAFRMIEISTAMATAAWVDTMVDPRMFKLKSNRSQSRRIAFLVSLIVGALVGAAVYRVAGSAIALYVSAAGKLLVAIIYIINKSDKPQVDESKV